MNYKIIRACLWFAAGEIVLDEEFWSYYTPKAVKSLLKDGFVEVVPLETYDVSIPDFNDDMKTDMP